MRGTLQADLMLKHFWSTASFVLLFLVAGCVGMAQITAQDQQAPSPEQDQPNVSGQQPLTLTEQVIRDVLEPLQRGIEEHSPAQDPNELPAQAWGQGVETRGIQTQRLLHAMKRLYPKQPIIGVGAVIVDGGRALLVRRATEPLKGEWSVPGGMLELGEKLRDGVRREALEETGLEVEPGELLDVFDSIFTDDQGRTQYHYVLIDYLCRPISGEAKAGTDVSEVRWVCERDLASMGLRQSIEQVVRKGLARAVKFTS